jgi:molecular chaperone GrpE
MPASEETGSGPVIHDHRRIDPVTGQVRGKHAASKPAGTTGAGRPAGPGATGTGSAGTGSAGTGSGSAGSAPGATDAKNEAAQAETAGAAEVLEGTVEDAPAAGQKAGQKQSDAEARLAERTADLQRLQAEYANYRKRVDRDRSAAREHGELSGGFKSVAESLQSAVGKLGLVSYGEKGDPFDPKIHEALTHTYSPDVTEETCVEIFQPGYKVGDKILRPARVAVAEPATGPDGSSNETAWSSGEDGN